MQPFKDPAVPLEAMEGLPVQMRTYHADSVADALAAIRRDLGAEAMILQTRSFRRGGFLGIGSRTVIEVTAAAAPARAPTGTAPTANGAPRLAPASAAKAYRQVAASAPTESRSADPRASDRPFDPLPEPDVNPTGPNDFDRERTRRLAMALLERQERENGPAVGRSAPGVAATPAAANGRSDTRTNARPSGDTAATTAPSTPAPAAPPPATPTAKRYLLVEPDGPPTATAPQPSAAPAGSTMRDELAAIRDLVEQVLLRQPERGAEEAGAAEEAPSARPAPLEEVYAQLVGQELARELAEEVVAKVGDELSFEAMADEDALRRVVLRHLEELIPVADAPLPPASPDGRPLTIAMIGPTGVGKTTTLAKLAAAFKLRHGMRVGLVTCDTYRIAAVEQLRTYANIIGVPLHVAMTPEDMRSACARLGDCDAVLIDTAGRSQNDTARIRDLRAFLEAAQPHEVHLVLSCTAGERVLLREAEAFSVVGADKVVLTKLDEAVSFGMLVGAIRQVGKTISFLTTGQEVPDQIEVGRSRRIAELILDGGVERP